MRMEHAIGHTQSTALNGRRLESIEAQNEFLSHWRKSWAARRIYGTERRQVQAMFKEERAHLKAPPLLGLLYFSEAVRTVCDDSSVRVDHSAQRSSAPRCWCASTPGASRSETSAAPSCCAPTPCRAPRHGRVAQEERLFNPSRDSRLIQRQASEIGTNASRLCELLFAIYGRVGQRKL